MYARQDRAREALETAEAALQQDPDNHEANKILGSVYAALSEQRQAFRPGDDPAQYRARAVDALEKSRRDAGVDLNLELMLGRLYLQAGNYDKAMFSLRRVVDGQPAYPEGRHAPVGGAGGGGADRTTRSAPSSSRSRRIRNSSAATSGLPNCTSGSAASRTPPMPTVRRRPRTAVRT